MSWGWSWCCCFSRCRNKRKQEYIEEEGPQYTLQTREFVESVRKTGGDAPNYHDMSIEDYRKSTVGFRETTGPCSAKVRITDITTIPNSDGNGMLSAKMFVPKGMEAHILKTFIHFPGGGFVSDNQAEDAVNSFMSEYGDCRVIQVNPRLAPEYKFPIPVLDAFCAIKYIFQHVAALKVDPNNVILSGSSSGATLAILALNMSRTKDLGGRISAGVFVSPTTDFSETRLVIKGFNYTGHDLFPAGILEYLFKQFLRPEDNPKSEAVSPVAITNADGLPPISLVIPEYDAIRHHSEAYYDVLQKLGKKDVELRIVKGLIHTAFQSRKLISDGEDMASVVVKRAMHLLELSNKREHSLNL